MAVIVLKGSTALYVGKEKGWEHRRNKEMVLQTDTRASSVQYKFLFIEEGITALVNYENLEWIKKKSYATEEPGKEQPLKREHTLYARYA